MSRLVHVNFGEAAYRQKLASVLALLVLFFYTCNMYKRSMFIYYSAMLILSYLAKFLWFE